MALQNSIITLDLIEEEYSKLKRNNGFKTHIHGKDLFVEWMNNDENKTIADQLGCTPQTLSNLRRRINARQYKYNLERIADTKKKIREDNTEPIEVSDGQFNMNLETLKTLKESDNLVTVSLKLHKWGMFKAAELIENIGDQYMITKYEQRGKDHYIPISRIDASVVSVLNNLIKTMMTGARDTINDFGTMSMTDLADHTMKQEDKMAEVMKLLLETNPELASSVVEMMR